MEQNELLHLWALLENAKKKPILSSMTCKSGLSVPKIRLPEKTPQAAEIGPCLGLSLGQGSLPNSGPELNFLLGQVEAYRFPN